MLNNPLNRYIHAFVFTVTYVNNIAVSGVDRNIFFGEGWGVGGDLQHLKVSHTICFLCIIHLKTSITPPFFLITTFWKSFSIPVYHGPDSSSIMNSLYLK